MATYIGELTSVVHAAEVSRTNLRLSPNQARLALVTATRQVLYLRISEISAG